MDSSSAAYSYSDSGTNSKTETDSNSKPTSDYDYDSEPPRSSSPTSVRDHPRAQANSSQPTLTFPPPPSDRIFSKASQGAKRVKGLAIQLSLRVRIESRSSPERLGERQGMILIRYELAEGMKSQRGDRFPKGHLPFPISLSRSGYLLPRIIPSFYRGEIKKKKRYSDRAVRPCSFLLDADGQASSCRNGVGRQRLLPRGQLEGAEVRRRAFWLLIYSSTEQHPTAPVLLVGLH
ncbi:hypothetical protein RIF29_47034 [Crotalaria pallida]|uniref:Uncharacterized protein n=1 Tax=Crotalaria pallida TaxID=3830 RepID=A0AAN9DSB0_CROPI